MFGKKSRKHNLNKKHNNIFYFFYVFFKEPPLEITWTLKGPFFGLYQSIGIPE